MPEMSVAFGATGASTLEQWEFSDSCSHFLPIPRFQIFVTIILALVFSGSCSTSPPGKFSEVLKFELTISKFGEAVN